ncbi:UNKNOWN [Stylonychia lemnae]|uniref:Cyclic nucleotide-binding domain-containing protein n=1 Tax=Stylonychia lemnae TaxID=5949 RepID=A0A078B2M2_STYLE|nr:UNKNOWN [Stylonychia lemnae]|eukprot:CDW88486.1 UNKNOWN [Stylonychia lemnae]
MDFGLVGSMSVSEMRKIRVREIVQKAENDVNNQVIGNIFEMNPSREQLDNGKFISKYFDLVNNKQYQLLFCQYNESMLGKLQYAMKFKQLEKGELLYTKGDTSQFFYFVLRGRLEILVDNTHMQEGGDQDQFKFSKNGDESEFFGLRTSVTDLRHDYARVASEKAEVLIIDKDLYEQIVKRTQLSASEQKIDFLVRYIPKFRSVARKLIEEMEILFIKEVATQGYVFQKQDDQDDYLYFVFRGKCRVLLSTATQLHNEPVFPEQIQQDKNRKNVVIGYVNRGECFGEHSALNDYPNPYTIEVFTKKAEVYKILRSNFAQYFGGLQGEPVERLRASIILKQNWLKSKLELIKQMRIEQIANLEYRNESEHAKLKPTREMIKEVAYVKNNPREKELIGINDQAADQTETRQVPATMTARQREIERLKNSLMQPMPGKPIGGTAAVGIQKLQDNGPEENKFLRNMDWGTPRLVTKNRNLVMDQNQLKQRNFLQNMAMERKGIASGIQEERKQDFAPVSVKNFREKMLLEEKQEMEIESKGESSSQGTVVQQPAPMRQMGVGIGMGGGASMFNKMKNSNEVDMKNKLKSNFKGLPI